MRASSVRNGHPRWRVLLPVALALLVAGCEGCGACDPAQAPRTPYLQPLRAPPEEARRGPNLIATRLAAVPGASSLTELLVRTADGRLHLGRWMAGAWRFEAVAEGVLDQAIAVDREGEDLFTAHVARAEARMEGGPGVEPPPGPVTGAHPEAPYRKRPAEGDLVVIRHPPGEPPLEAVAAQRAMAPAMRVDPTGAVHLAFIQPAGREGWAAVYLRVTPEGVERRELGPAEGPFRPSLVLEAGAPVVAWVAPGPEVQVSRWRPGGVVEVRPLPRRLLGEPRVVPSAFDVLPGAPPLVAWVRPLPGGEVQPVNHPVDYPPGTEPGAHLLMVATVEDHDLRERALAAAPLQSGPAQVYVSRSGASIRLAATVHGLPVQAERQPEGWRVWVPVPGQARAVAGAGEEAVYATDQGLWFTTFWDGAEAPARAEGVAPGVGGDEPGDR